MPDDPSDARRRVVITGIGPISAYGVGMDPLWEAMLEGRSAIGRVDRFAEADMPCPFAAELAQDAFDVRKVVPKSYRKATKVMCRDIVLAVGAAAAAVEDARLVTRGTDPDQAPTIDPSRMGCHIGAGLISADVDELTAALVTSRKADNGDISFDLAHWGHTGMQNLTPLWLLKYLPNMLACHVTIIHDCQGPSNTITCCEASSALSLGESRRVIERGAADACLSGGAEYRLNPFAFLRQYFADRLADATPDEDPQSILRPFSPGAKGSVVGEGGGILILESLESAQARGVDIYAEVGGFQSTQSFCPDSVGLHIEPDDTSLADAIVGACQDAGVTPDDIDCIVPFGASIPHVDRLEAAAIRRVLGDRAADVPLILTVPFTGNCAAGHGAIGLCVAARAICEQRLPARLGTTDADTLDANAAPARDATLNTVLVLTPSQGGQNAAVVLKRI
ncbi:MAG: beta-ketoacyl-[acyl-carrier-protein] synthase family protein [Planctomycetota bacterium]|jgi:3-oxoacyl-[acyl-carrier-protein] synthase II